MRHANDECLLIYTLKRYAGFPAEIAAEGADHLEWTQTIRWQARSSETQPITNGGQAGELFWHNYIWKFFDVESKKKRRSKKNEEKVEKKPKKENGR